MPGDLLIDVLIDYLFDTMDGAQPATRAAFNQWVDDLNAPPDNDLDDIKVWRKAMSPVIQNHLHQLHERLTAQLAGTVDPDAPKVPAGWDDAALLAEMMKAASAPM